MGARYSAEQWAEWIDEQEGSGLTVFDFCDAIGVSTNSFYRWRGKLSASAETASVGGYATGEASEVSFVPLSIVGRPNVGIEIDLPCGSLLRVPGDEAVLGCVLRALRDAYGVQPDDANGAPSCLR